MSIGSYEWVFMHQSEIIEKLSQILKVLGDANRLGMVMAIGKNSRSVTEIIHATGLPQTLVSFHLRTLRNREIVTTKRDGPFIYYSLSEPVLIDILGELFKISSPDDTILEREFAARATRLTT